MKQQTAHYWWKTAFLGLATAFLFVSDTLFGSVEIPFPEVWDTIFSPDTANGTYKAVLLHIRLPRAITAVLAGAALSASGLMMQVLFRNPMAGPSVLGVTAGASLGVAAVMLASGAAGGFLFGAGGFLGHAWLSALAAVAGGTATLALVLLVAARLRDNTALLIVGLMLSQALFALVGIWQYFSSPGQIQEYLLWTFGSLGGLRGTQLWLLAAIVSGGTVLAAGLARPMDLLLMGENYAFSMGLPVKKVRALVILATGLLAGSVTAFCGPIAFVGLAVPHLARLVLKKAPTAWLLAACCLLGPMVLLACDLVSKLPGSQYGLPINAVTALAGAPVVLLLVLRGRAVRF